MSRIMLVPIVGLQDDLRFQQSVQLSRLLNAIQANKRHYLRIRSDDDPVALRDQIERILYHAAIVYEAILTVARHSRILSKLETWSQYPGLVKRIQREANNGTSFTQKYLKRIRNKVIFHYDLPAVAHVLSGLTLTQDTAFAESKSGLDQDLAFTLADEALLRYALSPISEADNDKGRWEYFQETLLDVSDALVEFLLRATVELAQGFTKIEESTAQRSDEQVSGATED